MQKYFVLTSVLALCACGGGSGGGVGFGAVDVPRAAVSSGALTSNSNITSMSSEILVAKDRSETLARAGTVQQNGKSYTSHRLDDVTFRVATGVDNAYMKFHMDTNPDTYGTIDSLVMNLGTGNQYMDRRNDTTADFRGIVYEYVVLEDPADPNDYDPAELGDRDVLVRLVYSPSKDIKSYGVLQNAADGKCPSGKICRWDRIDQAFRIVTNGQGGTDFRYSDFGKLQTTNFGKIKNITQGNFATATAAVEHDDDAWDALVFSPDDYDVFAGGYNILRRRPAGNETMHFRGKAMGSLYATDSVNHPDAGLALQDDNAELVFDPNAKTETLSMAFYNWYDVTVTKNNETKQSQILFDNYTNSDTTHVLAADETDTGIEKQDYFKFHEDDGTGVTKNNFTATTGTLTAGEEGVQTSGLVDMNYYGINSVSEAAGIVRYKEIYQDTSNHQTEHEFRAGYGMKPYTPPLTPEP